MNVLLRDGLAFMTGSDERVQDVSRVVNKSLYTGVDADVMFSTSCT